MVSKLVRASVGILSLGFLAPSSIASPEVFDVAVQDWYTECLQTFLKQCCVSVPQDTHLRYSNFYLIDKEAGLCTDHLSCAFDRCSYKGIDASLGELSLVEEFESVQDRFDPINLPSHIAFPETAGDVSSAIRHAKGLKKKVSIKATGHSYAGSSTVGDSLQLNLRNLHKYANDDDAIVECVRNTNDITDRACGIALARGKNAYVKVGGGDVWSDVYLAVMGYQSGKYDVVG
eukprot:CAMPEP_0194356330 /NCGR_PEP_ID=MMETSP0174-20130528/4020_1 /TAXON_ID=216777 /ORGANISM="Proboscia alata, Strain PI-D3" /LENGTH=231 /DNA_ID=CAMNT_0039125889 /DNA_START=123 /DNA_END=814 /DNA_ORIENTATION=-